MLRVFKCRHSKLLSPLVHRYLSTRADPLDIPNPETFTEQQKINAKEHPFMQGRRLLKAYNKEAVTFPPQFLPHKRAQRLPYNDPNVRLGVPEMPTKLTYMFHEIFQTPKEARSAYYSVVRGGVIYHAFNAAAIPVGRMCVRIATILQGKHYPTYKHHQDTCTDQVIVVNALRTKITGRKLLDKVFKYHTRYPGGLKVLKFKDLRANDPERLVRWVLRGMLPKNKLRAVYMQKLRVYPGINHDMDHLQLPQFTHPPPIDPNDIIGMGTVSPETTKIIYSSTPEIPEEFKDYPVEIDPLIGMPRDYTEKTMKIPGGNKRYYKKTLKFYKKYIKRFREYE